jgi:small subunit ribosomal protein S20
VANRTASAKKQARAGVRRALRNRAAKSEVKTLVVKARRSLSEGANGQSEAAEVGLEAVRALDRAAAKGILHGNNAGRRKGRLMRQLAKVGVAVAAPAAKPVARRKSAAPAASKPAAAGKKAAKTDTAAKKTASK